MPNHVSNVASFETYTDIEEKLNGLKLEAPSIKTMAMKLAILIVKNGKTDELMRIAEMTDYSEASDLIDGLIAKELPEDLLATARSFSCEASPFSLTDRKWGYDSFQSSISDQELITLITSPTPKVEIDWFRYELWFPMALGIQVQGFNASFNKSMMEKGMEDRLLDFPSGYDANINLMGTKWGIYDLDYMSNQIFFSTAWSPLSDEAIEAFLAHVECLIGAKLEQLGYWEGGSGFWGIVELSDDGGLYVESGDTDEYYAFLDIEDGESDERIKELEESGFEPVHDDGFSIWLHKDIPDILRVIT
jgi:hypothetical protein